MKRKIIIGIVFGIVAGIIDVIPMIIQKLTWDANIAAFVMWVVAGFFIATSEIKVPKVVKGILVSFLTLLPSLPIIAWNDQKVLLAIILMNIILGSLLGLVIGQYIREKK